MEEKRGSIACHRTYVPLDIFCCPFPPTSTLEELHLTDGLSDNYNCQIIPPEAVKTIIKHPLLATQAKESDVDSGRLSGMVFVSERDNLEILYIALRFDDNPPDVKVFSLADVCGTFDGVRLEDSGCVAGGYKVGNRTIDHFLVYITTKDAAKDRREPWTAVYKTNLRTRETERLTPSGKKIAVASFQGWGWGGKIEDLQTDIYVMNVEKPLGRRRVIKNGGWPTWGSENIIFFHRRVGEFWGVFRADINIGEIIRMTPDGIDAVTPAAINATKVAVATIRQKSMLTDFREAAQYRHIEIFDTTAPEKPIQITQKIRPKADHYNPFVIDRGNHIGYHRCKSYIGEAEHHLHKLKSPHKDVGVFRISGVFPTFSNDGSKLAFIDNEFKSVWLADSRGLRIVFETKGIGKFFAPVWNQNPRMDTLYVCLGPSFHSDKPVQICAMPNVSRGSSLRLQLTKGKFNNAFPSTNPEGTRLVFRSARDGDRKHQNLYILENLTVGEYGDGKLTRLTNGPWIDTHCQWSPRGDWIAFSSTRDKPKDAPALDNGLDPGYYAVFLVKAYDPDVVVRVITSGDDIAGHVNYPVFSPDGKSIAVASDLAGVTVDPISLPFLLHSVRHYGDIFTIDIDSDDINKNKDVKNFTRITHSRYACATPAWTMFSTDSPNATWSLLLKDSYTPAFPLHMSGQLCIPRRAC